MKKAFIVASLVSSVGFLAQTYPNDVYRLINASLLCKNLGFMDDAIDNSRLSVEFSNSVKEDRELLKAKSYTAQGLAYEEIPLAQNAAKDAFNNALKQYTSSNSVKDANGLSIDAQVAVNSLTQLRVRNSAAVNVICDSIVELKADDAAIIDPNGENEGGILKSEAGNKSKTLLRNPDFSKQDSLACTGIAYMNNNSLSEADKCFTAYIANNLNSTSAKRTSKKNENAVLYALNSVQKGKLSTNDYFQQLENSFKLSNANGKKLESILKDAKASQAYVTSLHILRENLIEEKEINAYNQQLDKCIAVTGTSAEALARLYMLKGISYKKEKNEEGTIENLKKGLDVFVQNKIHTIERTYLIEELEYLYRKTGRSKKVVIPAMNIHTGEKYEVTKYLPSPYTPNTEEIFAGIEIGSSGVKFTLNTIEKFENPDRYEYRELRTESRELNVTSFEGQINRLVIQYVKELYDLAVKENKVPNDRILIAFSSGVNDAAQAKNRVMELEDIRNNILEQTNVEPEILTISQEAKYTHLGVLPARRRTEITSIDIGGENTKGGYFYGGTDYKWGAFTFEYGTKSLLSKVTDNGRNIYPNLNDLTLRLKEMMNTQTQYLREEMSEIMKEDERVLFAGGISWVVGRVMRPNKIMKTDYIDDVTISDIRLFKSTVAKIGLAAYMEQQLRTVTTLSAEEKDKLLKEYEDIKSKKFTNERCISGATILETMMEELDRGRKTPHIYTMSVRSVVGWLTGKMVSCSEGNCR
jgi:hypothetical protein